MKNNFELVLAKGDLCGTKELVMFKTYSQVVEELKDIVKSIKGKVPPKMMILVKKMIFKVNDSTTLEDVRRIASYTDEVMGTTCFQYAIYRDRQQAELLLDVVNHGTGSRLVFNNRSKKRRVSAYISIFLHQKVSKAPEDLRYYLIGLYNLNKAVFSGVKERIDKSSLSDKDKTLIGDCLSYTQGVCMNLIK